MSADQLELVLKGCDRTTIAGRRDFAVLLLLSRLGLRANEAACLSLDDIDWRVGLLRVKGKGGRIATMPLPQDVGAAISDYILHGRPTSAPVSSFIGLTPHARRFGRRRLRGDKQGETRIASPKMLLDYWPLPHLISSQHLWVRSNSDEAHQRDDQERIDCS
ncbi:tyrosine-type recombinase/integrase, partial [Rhizobium favelukesii]|uniref:tyrosine-type recombinase/integrase n=1 Tax=Rhizobium favelukesii TaxID=348824 RepID=UPI00215F3896